MGEGWAHVPLRASGTGFVSCGLPPPPVVTHWWVRVSSSSPSPLSEQLGQVPGLKGNLGTTDSTCLASASTSLPTSCLRGPLCVAGMTSCLPACLNKHISHTVALPLCPTPGLCVILTSLGSCVWAYAPAVYPARTYSLLLFLASGQFLLVSARLGGSKISVPKKDIAVSPLVTWPQKSHSISSYASDLSETRDHGQSCVGLEIGPTSCWEGPACRHL